jgi:hypothetical protein
MANVEHPPTPSILDNLNVDAVAGAVKPPGEHSTPFGTMGAT